MKKNTLLRRIISGATAAAISVTMALSGAIIEPLKGLALDDGPVGKVIFSQQGYDDLHGMDGDQISATINLGSQWDASSYVTVPENTYYLRVHVIEKCHDDSGLPQDDPSAYTTYVNHIYQLVEISGSNIYSWNSGNFRKQNADNPRGNWYWFTDSVEGELIRNLDPSTDLTMDQNGTINGNYAATDSIMTKQIVEPGTYQYTPAGYQWPNWVNENGKFTVNTQQATQKVRVEVYDYEGNPSPLIGNHGSTYVLSALFNADDKNGTKEWSPTEANKDKIVGWRIDQIDIANNDTVNLSVSEFNETDLDADSYSSGNKIKFDPNKYYVASRVFTSSSANNMKDLFTNGADSIAGYTPGGGVDADGTKVITFTQEEILYDIDLVFDKPVSFAADDNYYIYLEVAHSNGEPTFYYENLNFSLTTPNVDGKYVHTVHVQVADDSSWTR